MWAEWNQDTWSNVDFLIQRPALSFRVSQAYFESNLSNQNNLYLLENGFYERTIPEENLDFYFDAENERKLISLLFHAEFHSFCAPLLYIEWISTTDD